MQPRTNLLWKLIPHILVSLTKSLKHYKLSVVLPNTQIITAIVKNHKHTQAPKPPPPAHPKLSPKLKYYISYYSSILLLVLITKHVLTFSFFSSSKHHLSTPFWSHNYHRWQVVLLLLVLLHQKKSELCMLYTLKATSRVGRILPVYIWTSNIFVCRESCFLSSLKFRGGGTPTKQNPTKKVFKKILSLPENYY